MSISEERKKKIEQLHEQNRIFSEMVKKLSQMGYSNKEITAGLNIPESSVIVFKYKESEDE